MSRHLRIGKATRSGVWVSIQQAVVMGCNSLLALLLIRTMAVDDYGTYAYATSLIGLGLAVMTAGLAGLAVKSLVESVDERRTLTTLLMVREVFAVLSYAIVCGISVLIDADSVGVVLIAGIAIFFRATDVPEFWYVAQVDSRDPALIRIVVSLGMLATRTGLLIAFPSLAIVIVLFVVEAAVASGAIWTRFSLSQSPAKVLAPASLSEALILTRSSFPLMLSGIAAQLNSRGDVLVIQAILGSSSVAVYSSATRVSEIAYFLPVVFMNATFPAMLKSRSDHGPDSTEYKAFVQKAYDRAFWTGVVVSVGVAFLSFLLFVPIFGEKYAGGLPILLVQLLACPFVFMSAVFSKWLIAEAQLWQSLVRHGIGAFVNLSLNLALVPRFGLLSAAGATVASYVIASYLSCFLTSRTRPAAYCMTRAIVRPLTMLGGYLR